MRRWIIICAPVLLTLLLSGCWNYSELNDRTIIAGAAVDRMESGEILLTAETIDFTDGQTGGAKAVLLSGQGGSVAEAVQDIMDRSGKELYWHHATLLILGAEYAEDGIDELLDYILNEHEMRLTLTLAVSRLDTAAEVFKLECPGEPIRSFGITAIIREQSRTGKTVQSDAYEVIDQLAEPGAEFVVTQIESDNGKKGEAVNVAGCAVFADDRMVGWLDADNTVLLQMLSGELEHAEFDLLVGDTRLSVRGREWRAKTVPRWTTGGVTADVMVRGEYEVLTVLGGSLDVTTSAGEAAVNAALERLLQSRLHELVEHLQSVRSDALGWGRLLWQREPAAFRAIPSWKDMFAALDVRIGTDLRSDGEHPAQRIRSRQE